MIEDFESLKKLLQMMPNKEHLDKLLRIEKIYKYMLSIIKIDKKDF